MPELYLDNFTNWSLSVVTYLWVIFCLVGNSTWMPQIQAMLYVHDLQRAYKSNKTTQVKFTVYWPVINHVTVIFYFIFFNWPICTKPSKLLKELLEIMVTPWYCLYLLFRVQYQFTLIGLFSLTMFTLYVITLRADTKVWIPIPYVTRQFRAQRGAASLRYRNGAKITVLMCE